MRRFLSAIVLTAVLFSGLPSANLSIAQTPRKSSAKAAPVSLAAQRGVDTINAAELKDYLSFIASDEMEGRDTPSRGLDTTAKFLAMNLSRWGFKPAGDDGSYFQKIGLRRDYLEKAETKVQLNGQTLIMGDDYIPYSRTANVSAPLVFAGSGWFVKSKNIDGYKGIDAKGKIAIVVAPPDGLPRGVTRADLSGKRGEDYMTAGEYAQKQGVVGLVFIPDFQYLANWDRNRARLTERGVTRVEKFQTSPGALISANHCIQRAARRRLPEQGAHRPCRSIVEIQRRVDGGADQRAQVKQPRNGVGRGHERCRQRCIERAPVRRQHAGGEMPAGGMTAHDERSSQPREFA